MNTKLVIKVASKLSVLKILSVNKEKLIHSMALSTSVTFCEEHLNRFSLNIDLIVLELTGLSFLFCEASV
jgi:hypothetical protein